MTSPVEPSFDEVVGRNIQELRKARGVSQAVLAKKLEERGLPFRQQTVVKVEKGQRPLRLVEAEKIARVLEVDIRLLVEVDDEPRFDRLAMIIRQTEMVEEAWGSLEDKAIALYDAQSALAHSLMWFRHDTEEANQAPLGVLGDAETLLAVDPIEVVKGVSAKLAARYATREAESDSGILWRDFNEEGVPHNFDDLFRGSKDASVEDGGSPPGQE